MRNNTFHLFIFLLFLLLFLKQEVNAQSVKELKKGKVIFGLTQGIDNTKNQSHFYSTDFAFYVFNSSVGAIENFQFSLFNNYTFIYSHGVQFSLISNVAGKSKSTKDLENIDYVLKGGQISALINRVEGNGQGFQSSLYNEVKGTFSGVQVGLNNKVHSSLNGLSLGVFNQTSGYNGVQIGLFSNISTSHGAGMQIALFNFSKFAGFLSKKSLNHLQVGVVNVAPSNSGLQVGLINVSKKNNGLPIGLINIGASNGAISISTDELLNTKIMLGTGGSHFHNRVGLGYNFVQNQLFDWSFSYGVEFNFHTSSIYDYGFFNDLIYLRHTEMNWYDGYWVNRTGFLFVYEYLGDKFFPILTTIHLNASPSEGLHNTFKFNLGNFSLWPGFSIGLRI